MSQNTVDVVVVGGGPAGLSAAVSLGRSLRSVLVVDAGQPRNAPAEGVHGYLGREGTPPTELLAIGRQEAAMYGVDHLDGRVVDAVTTDHGFTVTIESDVAGAPTNVNARRLIVASGLVDELPDVPGIAERWGHEVIHCPYCHGYEVRGKVIGVLATSPMWWHQLGLFRQLSERVVLLTNEVAEPDAEQSAALAARNVEVVDGKVAEILNRDGVLSGARIADGREVALEALTVTPRFVGRQPVLAQLGVTSAELPNDMGQHAEAQPMSGATNVAGVYVAGNVTDLMANVIASASNGTRVGAVVNADLVEADMRAAVG